MSDAPPDWLAQPAPKPAPAAPAWAHQAAPPPAPPAGWTQVGPNQVAGPHVVAEPPAPAVNAAPTAAAGNPGWGAPTVVLTGAQPVAAAQVVPQPTPQAPAATAQPAAHAVPQPHAAMLDTVKARAYAEWLAWARRQFHDLPRAQAAARGAFAAAVQGADADTAGRVGVQAAADPAAWPPPLETRLEVYATWFAWAHLDMRAPEELAHKAASAASAEQARGSRPELVAQAAQGVLGAAAAQHRAAASTSFTGDPAFKPIVYAVVVLALPVFTSLVMGRTFFFGGVFPILGIIYSIRAFGASQRPILAASALGLNLLGIAATALLWIVRFSG